MVSPAFVELTTFLNRNRLTFPPFLEVFEPMLVCDPGNFDWRHIAGPEISPFDDYMVTSLEKVISAPQSPQFALNHAGHGINSYGLNLRIAVGRVLVMVQFGWGGGYMDSSEQVKKWNEGMRSLSKFFNDVDPFVDIHRPIRRNDFEVAVMFSDFRGFAVLLPEGGRLRPADLGLETSATLSDVLRRVILEKANSWKGV